MKIVVIGGSGLIGNYVVQAATAAGHGVTGTFHKFSLPGLVQLECADAMAVRKLLDKEQPQAVVYAAGWTWVDGCEDNPGRAFAENVDQPLLVANWCHHARCRFVYFSTSYVFDGASGPYVEDAAPNPINVYGRAKLKAEQAIAEATAGAALIPRVIYVYGAEAQQKNFACQVWRAMESGKALTVPSDQEGNPTFAGDIGRWTIELLEKEATGIWHIAGADAKCDKAEWARQLAAAFQAAGVQPHRDFAISGVVTDQAKQRAPRPLRAGLLTPRVATLKTRPSDLKAVIADMVRSGGKVV